MEINKQLFEDILSGKLKGTFVLRDGSKISSSKLIIDTKIFTYPIFLNKCWYTYQGEFDLVRGNHPADIIDFIPDTDMKENELTFEIPDGKIVDWDESKKQNKIVLKDKQLTYKDVCNKLFNGKKYYTDSSGEIRLDNIIQYETDPNNATTEHQLECILAKNKLANVAVYLNNGWIPIYNTQFPSLNESVWIICCYLNGIRPEKVMQNSAAAGNGTFFFKSEDLAQQAIEILGEETVKLALEPLGI